MKLLMEKIVSRTITLNRVMFVRQRLFKQPAQTTREIKIIKELFEFFKGKKISIFEYGIGYSTFYYAQYLHNKGYQFQWHCIDNSEIWFNNIRSMIKSKSFYKYIFIYLKQFKPFWEKPGWDFSQPVKCGDWKPTSETEDNYINFPNMFSKKFDIIFIDGRFRRRCLLVAKQCLDRGGIVVLHDAQKEHYHSSLAQYAYQTFVNGGRIYPTQKIYNMLWFGSNDNLDLNNAIRKKFSRFLIK